MLVLAAALAVASPKSDAQAAVLATPSDAAAWAALGDASKGEAAAAAYSQALLLDPWNDAALTGIARWPSAEQKELEKAALANPSDPALWGALGVIHDDRHEVPAATEAWAHALRLAPTDLGYQVALYEHDPALFYDTLADALPLDESNDESVGVFAQAYEAVGDIATACGYYEAANALDPEDGYWGPQLQTLCYAEPVYGDFSEGSYDDGYAAGVSDGYAQCQAEAELSSYGRDLIVRGQVDDGRASLHGEFAADPTNPDLRRIYALATGKTEVDLLRARIEADPGSAPLWVALGDARVAVGDPVAARSAYAKAVEIDPDGPGAERLLILDALK